MRSRLTKFQSNRSETSLEIWWLTQTTTDDRLHTDSCYPIVPGGKSARMVKKKSPFENVIFRRFRMFQVNHEKFSFDHSGQNFQSQILLKHEDTFSFFPEIARIQSLCHSHLISSSGKIHFICVFLVATKRLYKSVCSSVGRSNLGFFLLLAHLSKIA